MTRALRLLGLLLMSLSLAGAALAQFSSRPDTAQLPGPGPIDSGHALVSLLSEADTVVPGEPFALALDLELDAGWHVYWRNYGDSGLPPRLIWSDDAGAEIADFEWSAPHEQPLDGLMNYGFEERLTLPFNVTLPKDFTGDTVTLATKASFLICLDICIPESADLELTLNVGTSPVRDADGAARIAQVRSDLPRPIAGEARIDRSDALWTLSVADDALTSFEGAEHVRFFPYDNQIKHPPAQPVSFDRSGFSLQLTPDQAFATDGNIAGVIVAEFKGGARVGVEIDAIPGDPLPGTLGAGFDAAPGEIIGADAQEVGPIIEETGPPANPNSVFNWNKFWLAVGLGLIGGAVLNLMPCVLPVLSIKAVGLAQAAANGDSGHVRLHGLAYAAGVVLSMLVLAAALIGLKAAGQSVGIGTQLQLPAFVVVLAIIVFLVGLNLYGFFEVGGSLVGLGGGLTQKQGLSGAFFTGVLAAVLGAPCIGPFLGFASGFALAQPGWVTLAIFIAIGIGLALPFALISFAPGLQKAIPKPGIWMVRLRQAFAFPMFATAAWLIYVLARGSAGPTAALYALFAATAIAFAIWAFKARPDGAGRGRTIAASFGALGVFVGGAMAVAAATHSPRQNVEYSEEAVLAAREVGEPIYVDWSERAVDAALSDEKAIFVDFTAAWCVTCQANKQSTLNRRSVKQAFAENDVVFMEADWTDQNDVIRAELERHGRAGVPLYLYYPPGKREPLVLNQVLSPSYVIGIVRDNS